MGKVEYECFLRVKVPEMWKLVIHMGNEYVVRMRSKLIKRLDGYDFGRSSVDSGWKCTGSLARPLVACWAADGMLGRRLPHSCNGDFQGRAADLRLIDGPLAGCLPLAIS